MITTVIGRVFLDEYNKRNHSQYDAKTFFIEKYHKLFFDDAKYMQWVQNSPFVQMKKGQKVETLTAEERKEKLDELISKIEAGARDASVAIGYSASEEKDFATTSGQVTNIDLNVTADDIFCSWIGSSLAVCVQGGLNILFYNPEILYDIYEGWSLYRSALNSMGHLKGNQIFTWNGQWLSHRYDKRAFLRESPMADFSPFETAKDGTMSVSVQSWTKILVRISQTFHGVSLLGYVYNIGQMKTTVGFIPIILPDIRKPSELYEKIFGIEESRKAEPLFGTAVGFEKACQSGSVGLKALEPKGLRASIEQGLLPKYSDNENKKIEFHAYLIWIMAMLNSNDLWGRAEKLATILKQYASSDRNARTGKSNKVKETLKATGKKDFIKGLTEIISDADNVDEIKGVAKLVNDMPNDNVPYFLTLIRFLYVAETNTNK